MWDYSLVGLADVRIETFDAASELIAQGWPTAVISIVGDREAPEAPNQFILTETAFDRTRKILPRDSFLLLGDLVQYSRNLKADDKLLIHSEEGLALCPATMMLVILARTACCAMTAHNLVRRESPTMRPDQRVIAVIDDYFNLRQRLVAHNAAYLQRHPL